MCKCFVVWCVIDWPTIRSPPSQHYYFQPPPIITAIKPVSPGPTTILHLHSPTNTLILHYSLWILIINRGREMIAASQPGSSVSRSNKQELREESDLVPSSPIFHFYLCICVLSKQANNETIRSRDRREWGETSLS